MQALHLFAQRADLTHQVAFNLPLFGFDEHRGDRRGDQRQHGQAQQHHDDGKRTGRVGAGNNVTIADGRRRGEGQPQAVGQRFSARLDDPEANAPQAQYQHAQAQRIHHAPAGDESFAALPLGLAVHAGTVQGNFQRAALFPCFPVSLFPCFPVSLFRSRAGFAHFSALHRWPPAGSGWPSINRILRSARLFQRLKRPGWHAGSCGR